MAPTITKTTPAVRKPERCPSALAAKFMVAAPFAVRPIRDDSHDILLGRYCRTLREGLLRMSRKPPKFFLRAFFTLTSGAFVAKGPHEGTAQTPCNRP